jgi:DMSO/TMAO reductase YedYZ molybdopterin-dependent catalytic subunit
VEVISTLDSLGRVALFRSRALKKVEDAGYDPARLPPGQYLTEKWPVLQASTVPNIDLATWDFTVSGLVEEPLRLIWEQVLELPAEKVTVDIHCVTRWSRFDTTFRGVRWRELAALARPQAAARFAIARAEQGYTANLPLEALEADDALIAYEADGAPLTPDHGWPLRLVVPSRYFWKSAKWLRGIELRSTDQPGFWERYGYHNDADPWREERYGF